MWTPRRILILLAGLAGCVATYAGYAYFLGGIDGLPTLPAKYVTPSDGEFDIAEPGISPTIRKLELAFRPLNPSCPEARDSTTYQIRLEMPQPDDTRILLATGPMEIWKDRPQRVTVAPISVAIFGKPKAPGERTAETQDPIYTIHADKAVLEFDRPVSSPQDMSRNRLIGVELIGDPDVLSHDRRKGRVTLTSNQGFADPEKWLVLQTPGPVYYTAPSDPTKPPPPDVPQIRSSAPLILENRNNVPRPLRGKVLPVGEVRGEDLRSAVAVRDMILGVRTPPPTVSAEGFKLYLQPAESTAGKPPGKGVQTGFAGLRKIELTEKVAVSLWTGGSDAEAESSGGRNDPPAGAVGLAGAAADGATLARRLHDQTLVTIETLGPFTYDTAKNTAQFRFAPHVNPSVPNFVMVHRVSARGPTDSLVCDVLELEFEKALVESPERKAPKSVPPALQTGFRAVTATGRQVLVTGEAERFAAQGTELRYSTDPKTGTGTTVLTGAPVTVVREQNKMTAGTNERPAVVTVTNTPNSRGAAAPSVTSLTIQGPGRIDLTEPGAKEPLGYATWAGSLTYDKARIGPNEFDRLEFVRGSFQDAKGGFDLAGDRVHLWLEPAPSGKPGLASASPGAAAKPVLLQAAGHVSGGSDQFKIEKSDVLNVWFRDGAPPAAKPAAVAQALGPVGGPPSAVPPPGPAAAAPVPQPPVRLSARTVDAWFVRTTEPATRSTAYALELAHCHDRVEVHQAPVDPKKNPRGLDLSAERLHMEGRVNEAGVSLGYFVTVEGTAEKRAEVHFESVSLTGPKVEVDQPKNVAKVTGRGKLRMPTGSALNGASPGPATAAGTLDVLWAEEMRFTGADGVAVFTGKVQAEHSDPFPTAVTPGEDATEKKTWLACHKLDVRFDRPVYFNQVKKSTDATDAGPKVAHVSAYPQPDEDLLRSGLPPGEKVSFVEEVKKRDRSIASAQRLTALVLEFEVRDRESVVTATGPGEIRVLRPGAKDLMKVGPSSPPAVPASADESEMKLTLVTFKSRLLMNDQGKKFQKATFQGGVEVYHVPSSNLNLDLAPHAMPARGLYMTCQDKMQVTTYQRDGRPAEQQLLAEGNAEVRTDEYSGRGATISYDGRVVELAGKPPRGVAYLYNANPDGTVRPAFSGDRILYNRNAANQNDRIKVINWADGTFGK